MTAQDVIDSLPIEIVHDYDMDVCRSTGRLIMMLGKYDTFVVPAPFKYTHEEDGVFHLIASEHCAIWIHSETHNLEIEVK